MRDELLEPGDVARLVKRPVNWLAKARCTGAGPKFLKVGGRIRYRRGAVDEWLDAHEHASTATSAKVG